MTRSCIACAHVFGPEEVSMRTPIGELCVGDAVPAYNVYVEGKRVTVIAWTPELIDRINTNPRNQPPTPGGALWNLLQEMDASETCAHGTPVSRQCDTCEDHLLAVEQNAH